MAIPLRRDIVSARAIACTMATLVAAGLIACQGAPAEQSTQPSSPTASAVESSAAGSGAAEATPLPSGWSVDALTEAAESALSSLGTATTSTSESQSTNFSYNQCDPAPFAGATGPSVSVQVRTDDGDVYGVQISDPADAAQAAAYAASIAARTCDTDPIDGLTCAPTALTMPVCNYSSTTQSRFFVIAQSSAGIMASVAANVGLGTEPSVVAQRVQEIAEQLAAAG